MIGPSEASDILAIYSETALSLLDIFQTQATDDSSHDPDFVWSATFNVN